MKGSIVNHLYNAAEASAANFGYESGANADQVIDPGEAAQSKAQFLFPISANLREAFRNGWFLGYQATHLKNGLPYSGWD